MNKQDYILYWKKQALRDWETAKILFDTKQYVFCLFVCHLVTEKLLKAVWVRDNLENTTPFTHNLEMLYNATNLNFDNEKIDLLRIMNSWNIEGRYQDYKDNFYKNATKDYVEVKLKNVEDLLKCLLKELQ